MCSKFCNCCVERYLFNDRQTKNNEASSNIFRCVCWNWLTAIFQINFDRVGLRLCDKVNMGQAYSICKNYNWWHKLPRKYINTHAPLLKAHSENLCNAWWRFRLIRSTATHTHTHTPSHTAELREKLMHQIMPYVLRNSLGPLFHIVRHQQRRILWNNGARRFRSMNVHIP